MGVYVDPIGMTKDQWLERHAREVPEVRWTWENRPEGELPLCRIQNPAWAGVLVAVSPRELARALPRPGQDERPRRYYFAPIDALRELPDMGSMFQAIRQDVANGTIETDAEL